MFEIELIDGYYIEVDELNYTLKQRYTGKTKDGSEREGTKTIGYYPDVNSCLEKLVKLEVISELDGRLVDMREYACKACEAFEKVYSIKISIKR